MSRKQIKPLITGAIIIAALVVLRIILPLLLPQVAADFVKFFTVFLAILMAFIFFGIVFVSKVLEDRVPKRLYRVIEYILIGGILLGVVCMFQPWAMIVYRIGFHMIFFSLLGFMIWGHTTPKGARPVEDLTSVSVSGLVEGGIEDGIA